MTASQDNALLGREKPCRKETLRFGDLIAAVYGASGNRRARGMLRLAVNGRVVGFRGHQRFLITEE